MRMPQLLTLCVSAGGLVASCLLYLFSCIDVFFPWTLHSIFMRTTVRRRGGRRTLEEGSRGVAVVVLYSPEYTRLDLILLWTYLLLWDLSICIYEGRS